MKKYEFLVNDIQKKIPVLLQRGETLLPTEQETGAAYGVSRQTVRRAYAVLEEKRLIRSVHGSGTYLTGILPDQANNQIALLLTTDAEYIYPQLRNNLGTLLSREGYTFTVYTTDGNIGRERSLLQTLLEDPPRGLIVEGCHNALPSANLDLYQMLQKQNCSVLFLYGRYPNDNYSIEVKDANEQGGYDLTEYLIRKGHRRIAGIFQSDTIQGRERYLGYISALKTYHAELPHQNVLWFYSQQLSDLQTRQDTRFLREFIQRNLMSCSAVVCYNDEIAYWLIRELHTAGIQVPNDMSVVGFDNSYLRYSSHVQLTTLAHETQTVSETVAGTILRMLLKKPVSSIEIPWKLIRGNSDRSLFD